MNHRSSPRNRDDGSILPLALVATVVLALVVTATATYATTTLRYGQVAEARAMRISAAQGALDDTLAKLRIGNAPLCESFDAVKHDFSGEINGLSPEIVCGSAEAILTGSQGWALAVTGENPSGDQSLDIIQFGNSGRLAIDGPVFVDDPTRLSIGQGGGSKELVLGPDRDAPPTHNSYYPCTTPADPSAPELELQPGNIADVLADRTYCINQSWEDIFLPGPSETLPGPAPASPWRQYGTCRVFWPGAYDDDPTTTAPPLELAENNYFLSGSYLFSDLGPIGNSRYLTFGRIDGTGFPGSSRESPCLPDAVADCASLPVRPDPATWVDRRDAFCNDGSSGAVVYLDGDTTFDMAKKDGGLDISGAQLGDTSVSIKSTCEAASCGRSIVTKSGAGGGNDELNFSTFGLVWAPYDSVGVAQVPASSGLGFQGGLIIGTIAMNMSGSGVSIRAASGGAPVQLMVQATATDDRGSNTVRAVVDYVGPPNPQLAVLSRRVVDVP